MHNKPLFDPLGVKSMWLIELRQPQQMTLHHAFFRIFLSELSDPDWKAQGETWPFYQAQLLQPNATIATSWSMAQRNQCKQFLDKFGNNLAQKKNRRTFSMHHFCLVTRIGKGSSHESLNVWVSARKENTLIKIFWMVPTS